MHDSRALRVRTPAAYPEHGAPTWERALRTTTTPQTGKNNEKGMQP